MPIIVPAPQVESQALQLPGAPALGDNGLGAVAQGASVAAGQLRAAQTELDTKRNATRVFEAESRLGDMEREMRTQNQARRGSDAYGVTDTVAGWWESEPAKISADLENETQRTLFAEAVARRREISLNSFSTHEANESNAAVNDATEARKVNAINYGAANYDDPTAVTQARQDLLDSVSVQGRFNGLPPDQVEALKLDALTKLHTNVIENMVDTDAAGAAAYFAAHKDEIAGSTHDAINTKLTAGKDYTAAQQAADGIWARGLSETEALAAVRKETEGAVREQALSLLRQQYNDQEAAGARLDRAKLEEISAVEQDGGYAALSPTQLEFMKRKYPGALAAMRDRTPQERVVTDWDVYDTLETQARTSPQAFADSFNPLEHRGDLNARQLQDLTKWRDDIIGGRPSAVATLTQVLNDTADYLELEGTQRADYYNGVREQLAYEQAVSKTAVPEARVREIVQQYQIEHVLPRSMFGVDALYPDASVLTRDKLRQQVQEIPATDRAQIENVLRARGLPVVDAAVYDLFTKKQAADAAESSSLYEGIPK